MSIEQQLQQHFHKHAEKLHIPTEIDNKIQKVLQTQHFAADSNVKRKSSRRFSRFALIAIVVLLLSGFAFATTQLLFNTYNEKVSYSYYVDSTLTLQHITGEEIRDALNYVKSQLEVGETAVVYLTDYAKEKHPLIQQYPLLSVTNPYTEKDYKHWQTSLTQVLHGYKLPESLLNTYSFVGGHSGYPLYSNGITPNMDQLTDSLRKEAKETKSKLVWKKIVPENSPITAYTSIYKHSNGDDVYITMELYPDEPLMVESFTSEAMTNGQINIDGKEAFYSHSKNIFSDTDEYQDLFWMENIDGQTVIYRIGTTSVQLTQEDLIQIAKHMN